MSTPEAPPEPPFGSPEMGPQLQSDPPTGAGRTGGVVLIALLVLVSVAVLVGPRLISSGPRPRLLDQSVLPAESDPGATSGAAVSPDYERQLVALVNAARLSAGCTVGVTPDARLREAALRHTRDMAAANRLSHLGSDGSSPTDRIVQAGFFGPYSGENVAQGYHTAKDVMAAWMASPDHRANIVNCRYALIGVGYVAHGQWWTETFGGG
jgi:uncharacterized protein YkwD